jgi:hypothetical protein
VEGEEDAWGAWEVEGVERGAGMGLHDDAHTPIWPRLLQYCERKLTDGRVLDNVRSAHPFLYLLFTESDYVSICAVMYVPLRTYMHWY